jgi:hypothetical protein
MRSLKLMALALATAAIPSGAAQAADIELLDLDCVLATGCLFSGNATDSLESVLAIETAYNTMHNPIPNPPLDLTGLYKTGDGELSGTSGTFTLPGGELFSFYAVKASNNFMLYQVAPTNSVEWTTAGLTNKQGNLQDISHLTVFALVGGEDPDPQGGVPEPSTWAMMLLGFGFIGGAMRSAKRRQRLAVAHA